MAEIADSDEYSGPLSSSPMWPASPGDDFDTDLEDATFPHSPSVDYSDQDEGIRDRNNSDSTDGDSEDENADLDFDFDMGDADVDFDDDFGDHGEEEGLFVDDYVDYADDEPDDGHIDPLHHALLNHLDNLDQHRWEGLFRSLSPMDHPNAVGAREGAGARPERQRDQLVQVEVVGQGNAVGAHRRQRQPAPDVIDLTGDDDDESSARSNPFQPLRTLAQRQSQNLRRRRSQQQNAPPRLNRSDGNYVGDSQQVIILSSSDDEDPPLRLSPRRIPNNINQNQHPNRRNHYNHHNNNNNINNNAGRGARNARFGEQPRQPGPAPAQNPNANAFNGRLRPFTELMQHLPFFHLLNNSGPAMAARNNRPDDDIVITGERNLGPLPGASQALIDLGPIHLDYVAHPFAAMPHPIPPVAAAGAPKPAHQPPNPARPGFTRDTGDDVVAICPSCDQELAYDPEGIDDVPATPAKRPRSKKAQAEHHFWAVKACGHVYCKKCFDNRRPTAKSPAPVGFREDPERGKKVLCAVEDCDSEVSSKAAWVGIFM
ncbi:hypothetical protein F5Y19DRAFT_261868 [Xylariaceae sp. FL1651]|nr:hypothetical protein F5Y19DRAFT_261868 [Xylariaceae sp. FL1651]